jgi:hypothetical protein
MLSAEVKQKMVMINSAAEIRNMIEGYTAEQMSLELLLSSTDESAMKLLRWYERLLMLCKLDYERYVKVKSEEHIKIVAYIHEHKLYHQWAELIPYIVMHGDTSDETYTALVALLSELGDTWLTFTMDRNTVVAGVTRDGKSLIEVVNPYHGFTDHLTEVTKKWMDGKMSEASYIKKITAMLTPEVVLTEREERGVNRILLNMIPFVNEKTKKCLPAPDKWVHHTAFEVQPLRQYFKGDKDYIEMLQKRKYIINSRGVTAKFKNAGNIRELLFMEDMTSYGDMYLIYKVTFTNGKETCGYLIPKREAMFSPFEGGYQPDSVWILYLFVLEVYADLTCAFEKPNKRLYALKEVESLDDPTLNSTNIYVEYVEYEAPEEHTGTRKSFTMKAHGRKHATRKLADGREASEMARERAKAMGIELQAGETYVRPYWTGAKNVREEIKEDKRNSPKTL